MLSVDGGANSDTGAMTSSGYEMKFLSEIKSATLNSSRTAIWVTFVAATLYIHVSLIMWKNNSWKLTLVHPRGLEGSVMKTP